MILSYCDFFLDQYLYLTLVTYVKLFKSSLYLKWLNLEIFEVQPFYSVLAIMLNLWLIDWLLVDSLHCVGIIGHIHGENCQFFNSSTAFTQNAKVHGQFMSVS